MDKSLKDRVKEKMLTEKISVPALSEATGIPSARIYKWYDPKKPANPKEGDSIILGRWLGMEQLEQVRKPEQREPLDKLAEANLINAKSIAEMVAMLKERDKALAQINANLAQIPVDMVGLTAKIQEAQFALAEEMRLLLKPLKSRSKTS